jgi:hypothetical protein
MALSRSIATQADPIPGEILHALARRSRRGREIGSGFAVTRPGIYKRAGRLTREINPLEERPARTNPRSEGKIMRKALKQLREMERYWNTVLDAFKRYAEGKMKQSKAEANRNGAAARKEPKQ